MSLNRLFLRTATVSRSKFRLFLFCFVFGCSCSDIEYSSRTENAQ